MCYVLVPIRYSQVGISRHLHTILSFIPSYLISSISSPDPLNDIAATSVYHSTPQDIANPHARSRFMHPKRRFHSNRSERRSRRGGPTIRTSAPPPPGAAILCVLQRQNIETKTKGLVAVVIRLNCVVRPGQGISGRMALVQGSSAVASRKTRAQETGVV